MAGFPFGLRRIKVAYHRLMRGIRQKEALSKLLARASSDAERIRGLEQTCQHQSQALEAAHTAKRETERLLAAVRKQIETTPDQAALADRFRLASYLMERQLPASIESLIPDEPVHIVDIGALELEGQEALYSKILGKHPVVVYGFEPQSEARCKESSEGVECRLLNLAIGDGNESEFYATAYPAASSTLKPNQPFIERFMALPEMLSVESQTRVSTCRLDDVPSIVDCDLLKLDIQGGEYAALVGASELLSRVLFVVVEVEFVPIYEHQPLFADVDSILRSNGLEFVEFLSIGYATQRSGVFGELHSNTVWADAVYMPAREHLSVFSREKLLKAFLLAHFAFRNPGLAARILEDYGSGAGSAVLADYQAMISTVRAEMRADSII